MSRKRNLRHDVRFYVLIFKLWMVLAYRFTKTVLGFK